MDLAKFDFFLSIIWIPGIGIHSPLTLFFPQIDIYIYGVINKSSQIEYIII